MKAKIVLDPTDFHYIDKNSLNIFLISSAEESYTYLEQNKGK